jgi:hypothetical protein
MEKNAFFRATFRFDVFIMKKFNLVALSLRLGLLCVLLSALRATATVYYVNANNTAPTPPYTTWATAAINIQDAINITSSGDTVLVTNGVYGYGGIIMAGDLVNRVALTNQITVQSVNGPWVTTILGAGATNGPNAVRCAWLTNGASLIGFTLQAGATRTSGDGPTLESGGGAWCASTNALIGNCLILSNTAFQYGGGVYQGIIVNSLICSNGVTFGNGGASYKVILNNCTLVSNTTYGAVSPIAMTNCIIYYNGLSGNYQASGNAFVHCCTTPALIGTGNITSAPQLFADGVHLATNSPCVGAGVNTAMGTDIFGNAWSSPPSIGCAEWNPGLVISQPATQFPITGGAAIAASIDGQSPFICWWTQNGQPVQNNGHYSSTTTPTLLINSINLSDAGVYQLVASNSFGMVTSAVSQVSVHCVASSGSEIAPYSDWTTAATNIQDAINAAQAGDFILVTNGVYAVGGIAMESNLTNRISLNKSVMVQSVNGPWVTSIQGGNAPNGNSALRCAWLTNGAALVGFTLQGGATRTAGDQIGLESGGGVLCASTNSMVENCLIYSNTAFFQGGGVYSGTLINCAIYGNSALYGGGSCYSYLNSCTVTTNSGGGTYSCDLTNCIVYYNSTYNIGASSGSISYCCTYPMPSPGISDFTNPPQLFVDNVHLLTNSPCIGAGTNFGSLTDIDGRPWANPRSVGCSEAPTFPIVSQPTIQLTNGGFNINAAVTGTGPFNYWWLENGTPLQNNGNFSSTQTPNLVVGGTLSSSDAGNYQLVVSNAFGVVTSAVLQVVIHCVNASGANPATPYLGWDTAATNIQDAITAAAAGDIVLVTNGVYAYGGISMDGVITNRVSVNKAILVQSVNGPNRTIIQGAWDPTSTNGPGAIRCAWLTNNTVLSGFTLQGGATRSVTSSPTPSMNGGGVYGGLTNATVYNCVIAGNFASYQGGGAYQAILNNCTLTGNTALGSGTPGAGVAGGGSGGGAERCRMISCFIATNSAIQYNGGGVDNCYLTNCAVVGNSAYLSGGGANGGSLVNCTVTANTSSGYSSGLGAAVYNATLTNCIVFGNFSRTSYPNTNYASCTMTYCCADPLPAGTGNIDVNPQLLPDGVHLATSSPCIGAGSASFVSGTDIDGQTWSKPPSMGCDEWQPAPVIGLQPAYQVNPSAHSLTFNIVIAGQAPINFSWSANGIPIQDNGHYSNSDTATLVVNNFGPDDTGFYQVVVSNAFGVVTSQVAQVVVHAVNAAGANPVAPYTTWATAAVNIQDAIEASSAGDIVLVTNGLYAAGGKITAGDLTNRVALDKAITVMSVNGHTATVIQGAWDPVSTNGPGAVRCAWVASGAVLSGFTLQNGATRAIGDPSAGGPLESGGGIYSPSVTSCQVYNCVLSNNAAIYGGGLCGGKLYNSLMVGNHATISGGGAFSSWLYSCTVVNNYVTTAATYAGAGVSSGSAGNSIILNNYNYPSFLSDNFGLAPYMSSLTYCCTYPSAPPGPGNLINVNPQFLDLYHIASTSLCRGAGNAPYATGVDLDGDAWNHPPSMGCSEVVLSNLVGSLSVNVFASSTNVFMGRSAGFSGTITGRASWASWNFGDGVTVSNTGANATHAWTNSGNYPVTFTVYNNDNPGGVSTNIAIQVLPLYPPQLQPAGVVAGAFQFQFIGQTNANYTIQYTTNLAQPGSWQTLQNIFMNQGSTVQINDPALTNQTRFYRVLVQ